ncbi:hypothetical protein CPC08DRAFT_358915 [Agrocybe pediades]|nr:hypothetical protein CPC08DRAFT_358915 [Agrocybe pediades]
MDVPIARDVQVTRFTVLSACCFLIYEHLITFDEEVNLIWVSKLARMSLGKVLFLLNRYFGLFAVLCALYGSLSGSVTDAVSFQYQLGKTWGLVAFTILGEAILQLRIYALYINHKYLIAFMVTCFVVSISLSSVVYGVSGVHMHGFEAFAVVLPNGERFCSAKYTDVKYLYTAFIPPLAFETFLFILALLRGLQTRRSRSAARSLTAFGGGARKRLADVLFRDSVIYFVLICAAYFVTLMLFQFAPAFLKETSAFFLIFLTCTMSNRLILSIRSTASCTRIMCTADTDILVQVDLARRESVESLPLRARVGCTAEENIDSGRVHSPIVFAR